MGVSRARAAVIFKEIRRLLQDESGIFPAALLALLGPAVQAAFGAWVAKLTSTILTPIVLWLLISLALRAIVCGIGVDTTCDPTRDIFFNIATPSRDAFGIYTWERFNNLVVPGVEAFWALGGVVAVLGVIVTGYEWYYSSMNPKARASLMETLWFWILGALALGFFPLWASFLLWANNQIVHGLAAGLPPGVEFGNITDHVGLKGYIAKITHPADYLASVALSFIGRGLLLFYFVFFKIRLVVLTLLLWVGPLLGGASLFFRRGAPIAARYWLELLSTIFVQSLLAFGAVFGLWFIKYATGAGDGKPGDVSLATMVELVAVLMALLPTANLLRTILGLPVGGMGVVSALGAGMIAGATMLVGQTMRSVLSGGGPVVSMPRPPIAGGENPGGAGSSSSGMGAGGGIIYGQSPKYPSLPKPLLQLSSGAESAQRAREAAAAAVAPLPPPPPPPPPPFEINQIGPMPSIDRGAIQRLRDNFAAGGALGGGIVAGLMGMGMGDPGMGIAMASGLGTMAGHKIGSAAGGAWAVPAHIGRPIVKAGAPAWRLAGDIRKQTRDGSVGMWVKDAFHRAGRDVYASVRFGAAAVTGWHPKNPREVNRYLVAKNLGVPLAEALGVRVADDGRLRGSGGPPGGPNYDPYLTAMFLSRGPSWYSGDGGEIRF